MKKNDRIVDAIELTSDSDYSYSSERKSSKKKRSKKKESKRSTKSKKSKKTQKKKSRAKERVVALPLVNLSDEDSDCNIEKIITISPINANTFNSMDIKRHSEDSQIEKCLKINDSESTVFSNISNDYLLFNKDDLYTNTDANLLKPIPPIKLETSCNSTLTNLTHQYNTKHQQQTFVKTAPIILSPAVNIIPIKPGRHYLTVDKPTLEPIRKKDDNIIEGMFFS